MQFFSCERQLYHRRHTQVLMTKMCLLFKTTRDIRGLHGSWIRPVSILWFITLSEILISNHNSAATPHKGRRSRAWKAQIQFKLREKKKLNLVWSAGWICGRACTDANPRQLGSFTCSRDKNSNWLKIYFCNMFYNAVSVYLLEQQRAELMITEYHLVRNISEV